MSKGKRKLWIDTRGEPVITTTPNGERNARRWGWTEAMAVPVKACGETFGGRECENSHPNHKLHPKCAEKENNDD